MTAIIENEEFWQKHLENLKASGLTRKQYCRDNEVDYVRFGYWIKRLSTASPSTTASFIPIKIKNAESLTPHITLCTLELQGRILRIHDLSALQLILDRMS